MVKTVQKWFYEQAVKQAKWIPAKLQNATKEWELNIFSIIEEAQLNNEKIDEIIWRTRQNLVKGWSIGAIYGPDDDFNKDVYPEDWLGIDAEVAVGRDLTKDIAYGKIVVYQDEVRGRLPLFAAPKKKPKPGELVLDYRVIRDGSKGLKEGLAVNYYTPERNYKTIFPRTLNIATYAYIFWLIYKEGPYIAKTDLKGAFRQLPGRKNEMNIKCYSWWDEDLSDCRDIWGSRSGSKNCQEVGILLSLSYNLKTNDKDSWELVKAIFMNRDYGIVQELMGTDDLLQEQKHQEIEDDIDMKDFDPKFNGQDNELQRMTEKFKKMFKVKNDKELLGKKYVHLWNNDMVLYWIYSSNIYENGWWTIALLKEWNGLDLLRLTLKEMDEMNSFYEGSIKDSLFIGKLINLRKEAKWLIKSITDNYVDDYFQISAPIRQVADEQFNGLVEHMEDNKIDEAPQKRYGHEYDQDIIGTNFEMKSMTLGPEQEKVDFIITLIICILMRGWTDVIELESSVGKLGYVAVLVWPGRAFLRRLTIWLHQCIEKYGRSADNFLKLPLWAAKDLFWWRDISENFIRIKIKDFVLKGVGDFIETDELYFDGATNGERPNWRPAVGGYYHGYYFSEELPSNLIGEFGNYVTGDNKEYNIHHFEMFAIVGGLNMFQNALKEPLLKPYKKYMIRTDSKTVESALKNKGSRDPILMAGARWVCMFAAKWKVQFYGKYINTKKNVLPDSLSRFDFETFKHYARSNGYLITKRLGFEVPNIHKW